MNKYLIDPYTGYWEPEFAINHHIHSQKVSDWIINFLKNEKETLVYDFGCGMGSYLNDLYNNGFTSLIGVEMKPPKNDYPFEIKSQNLAEPFDFVKKGNVISLEVGEHIPDLHMDNFLNNITSHCSNYLILSWAVRNQGGFGHFNELNNDEVIPHVINRGFQYLEEESMDIRKDIEPNYWYFKNTIMIFKKI
jgi:SAM-dependent methyltransferase